MTHRRISFLDILAVIIFALFFSISLPTFGQKTYWGLESSSTKTVEFPYRKYYTTSKDDLYKNNTTTYLTQYKMFEKPTGTQFLAIAVEHFKTQGIILIYVVIIDNGEKKEAEYYEVNVKDFTNLSYTRKDGNETIIHISFSSTKKEHINIHSIRENYFNMLTYTLDK
jgi:hypothetical protein